MQDTIALNLEKEVNTNSFRLSVFLSLCLSVSSFVLYPISHLFSFLFSHSISLTRYMSVHLRIIHQLTYVSQHLVHIYIQVLIQLEAEFGKEAGKT